MMTKLFILVIVYDRVRQAVEKEHRDEDELGVVIALGMSACAVSEKTKLNSAFSVRIGRKF